jgi:hypothetical protein
MDEFERDQASSAEPGHLPVAPATPLRSGMGPTPSGPQFAPVNSPADPSIGGLSTRGELPRPNLSALSPPRSRVPAVVTAAVLVVVATIVAAASIFAYHQDQRVDPAPPQITTSPPRLTATKDAIDFTTRTGEGRLMIVSHTWQATRGEAADPGSALQVQVELLCTSGTVDYDPFNFQAFDATGNLFDIAAEEARGPILAVGTLGRGERVRGLVAFVMPRGEVTLLMTDDASSVTALKVPD